jgi:hypothetical protein
MCRFSAHPGTSAVAGLSVNPVQQNVQQQGRTTARMHDRRQRPLPAVVVPTWYAPVVRIEGVVWLSTITKFGSGANSVIALADDRFWRLVAVAASRGAG